MRWLREYHDSLDHGRLPIARGLELSADDLARRSVIHGLMCDFAVRKSRVEVSHLIEFDRYFSDELDALREFQDMGLVSCDGDWITVAPKGRFVIRGICMAFDRYLRRAGKTGPGFSRVI